MDENFTNKIKHILNDPPDLPFDEKSWKDMEGRLYGPSKKRSTLLFYLIPLALLLWMMPMLFSWFAYQKLDEATTKIESLESQLYTQTTSLIDTVITRHETFVYDTIFKKIFITEKIATATNKQFQSPIDYSYFFRNKNPNSFTGKNNPSSFIENYFATNSSPFLFSKPSNVDEELNTVMPKDASYEKSILYRINMLGIKPLKNNDEPNLFINNLPFVANKKKNNLRYYLYKMQPTDFSLSSNAGTVFLPGFGFNAESGLSADVQAEFGYGKNWNMVIGAEYLRWKFKVEFEDDQTDFTEIFDNFPEPTPDAPDDQLHELKGSFNYAQLPIGFKYYFSNTKKIQPSMGLGIVAQSALRSSIIYEYYPPTGGEYKKTLNQLLPRTFEFSSLWGSLGIQYGLNDHWRVQLESIGQFDFGSNGEYKYQKINMVKIRGGVKYQF